MGFYADWLLPRCIDLALGLPEFRKLRQLAVQQLQGEVLEVGFGSGHNLPFLPSGVRRLYALDPVQTGRRLGRQRLATSTVPVDFLDWQTGSYPLPDASVDAVLSTWTMCSIADLSAALQEMRRVLRPGGQLFFVEHGLSPRPKVARWQRRLTPLQKKLAGGCHLDRDIPSLLESAGWRLEQCENLDPQRIARCMYLGRARAS